MRFTILCFVAVEMVVRGLLKSVGNSFWVEHIIKFYTDHMIGIVYRSHNRNHTPAHTTHAAEIPSCREKTLVPLLLNRGINYLHIPQKKTTPLPHLPHDRHPTIYSTSNDQLTVRPGGKSLSSSQAGFLRLRLFSRAQPLTATVAQALAHFETANSFHASSAMAC